MDDIEKLEKEIILLKKRISVLEGKENRRKAWGYIKTLEKIVVVILIIFAISKGYDYVVNGIPKIIEDKVNSINIFKKG